MTYNQETTELLTIRDWLRFAVSQFEASDIFYGHGTDNSYDEAVWLIMRALHLPLDTLDNFMDAKLTNSERNKLASFIEQRITKHTPTAYLLKEAWLQGFKFYVDERVLIPRSPIAELIERRFAPWVDARRVGRILDLGTGSGCIAIACARAFPRATVDASDISAEALEVASMNVRRHRLGRRVRPVMSDHFAALAGRAYDIIVSNPPYVGAEELAALPPEYWHEPRGALASGKDGLDSVRTILREAGRHLRPRGLLVVEVGNSEALVRRRFPRVPFTWLEFERGGGGVFLLTAEQVRDVR